MVKVRVPATSANLGPGFDCLGVALSLDALYTFEETEAGFTALDFPAAFSNSDNLIYRAYLHALEVFGMQTHGLTIRAESVFPAGRGLGSSATCVVSGILAAAVLRGIDLSKEELFSLATQMEGHPDNAAAAVYGGLRVSILEGERALSLPSAVHPDIRFMALIPDFDLPTHKARAALPSMVSMADAVYNLSRASFLLKALESGDSEAIRASCRDRLHQTQRFKLIPGGQALSDRMMELGADACFLSGAGPSLMCLYRDPAFLEKANRALLEGQSHFEALPLLLNKSGACIERTETIWTK